MEFPHLRKNCSFQPCNKLDFLPMKCGAYREVFCSDHFEYRKHESKEPNTCDVQVPLFPLCNIPVPGNRQEPPDVAVGAHINNQSTSDSAKEWRNKVLNKPCSYEGCKETEMVLLVCNECSLNYCLQHKHATDHACEEKLAATQTAFSNAAIAPGQEAEHEVEQSGGQNTVSLETQGNVIEDEAPAPALQPPVQEPPRRMLFIRPVSPSRYRRSRRQQAFNNAAMAPRQEAEHEVEQSGGQNTVSLETQGNVTEDEAPTRASSQSLQIDPRGMLFIRPAPPS